MSDVPPPVSPDVWATVLAPVVSAGTGVLMRYAERFRTNKPFDWRQIVVDIPVFGGAVIGGPALAEVMGWGPKTACGITMLIGYTGMRALDALWLWLKPKGIDLTDSK